MTMENKIVKVYVLKGLNGTSLVIENYRVSNEKIYGMLTPIYTFEVATDDILQAIGQKHNQSDDCVSREQSKMDVIPNSLYTSEQVIALLDNLSPVVPTHGTCKDCKHWKDSDGVYRRGIGAESKCPINNSRVFDGTFCCADFEKRGGENDIN